MPPAGESRRIPGAVGDLEVLTGTSNEGEIGFPITEHPRKRTVGEVRRAAPEWQRVAYAQRDILRDLEGARTVRAALIEVVLGHHTTVGPVLHVEPAIGDAQALRPGVRAEEEEAARKRPLELCLERVVVGIAGGRRVMVLRSAPWHQAKTVYSCVLGGFTSRVDMLMLRVPVTHRSPVLVKS